MEFHSNGTATLAADELGRIEDALYAYEKSRELSVAIGREVLWSANSNAYALAKASQNESGWFVAETLADIGFGA